MKTNKLSRIARSFLNKISIPFTSGKKVIDLTDSILSLPDVSLQEGYVIECLLPGNEGWGGKSILFARDKKVPLIPYEDITSTFGWNAATPPAGYTYLMDALSFEDTEEGIWSAVLVDQCWRFLPMWWHARYSEQKWLLDADMILNILKLRQEDLEILQSTPEEKLGHNRPFGFFSPKELLKVPSMIGDESLLPSVSRNDDSTWDFKYVFFNDWAGLVHLKSKAKCTDGKVTFSASREDNEILIFYDCGRSF